MQKHEKSCAVCNGPQSSMKKYIFCLLTFFLTIHTMLKIKMMSLEASANRSHAQTLETGKHLYFCHFFYQSTPCAQCEHNEKQQKFAFSRYFNHYQQRLLHSVFLSEGSSGLWILIKPWGCHLTFYVSFKFGHLGLANGKWHFFRIN